MGPVGPEGRVVPQQWLANTTAPGVAPEDRRRLDLVVYGATPNGVALCCDATLVSAVTRNGLPANAADSRIVLQLPLPEGARPHAIQSSAEADPSACACWLLRSAAVGAMRPTSSCGNSFGSGGARADRLARSGCAGVGASLVEHSGRRGPACCLQCCAGHLEHAGDPGRR